MKYETRCEKPIIVGVRFPPELFRVAAAQALSEDTDISKIVRRAMRRELGVGVTIRKGKGKG